MTWRNCLASATLAAELNARYPTRDRTEDGTIGDAAHASRNSDHNPWVKDAKGVGVVRARDIDEDLDGKQVDSGADGNPVFEHLLKLAKSGDPRLNGGGYLIYEGKLYSEKLGWAPRLYFGSNAHKKHIHVSFSRNQAGYDSVDPWGFNEKPFELKIGDKGLIVANLEELLNILSSGSAMITKENTVYNKIVSVPKDKAKRELWEFNCVTMERVQNFQRFVLAMWALGGKQGPSPVVDGIVGPKTLAAMFFWIDKIKK